MTLEVIPPRLGRLSALVGLLLASQACVDALSQGPSADPSPAALDRRMLSGDALARLGTDGRFTPTIGSPLSTAQLDAAEAQRAFQAMWRRFGPTVLASDLGRNSSQAEASRYRSCGPAVLAQTPVEPIGGVVPEWLRAEFGDRWLVPWCSDDATQLLVSVGARALSLKFDAMDGLSPEILSSAFKFSVVTPGATPLMSAEDAALHAYRATGQRVSGVPLLVLPQPPISPLSALWEVQIEVAVPVRGVRSRIDGRASRLLIGSLPSDQWRTSVMVDAGPLKRGTPAVNSPRADSTLQSSGIQFRTLGLALYAEVEPAVFPGRAQP